MKCLATLLLAAAAVLAAPAMAQDIGYSSSWPLTLPHDTFFGMAAGVATDSKGHVLVYTRNTDPILVLGGSRAFAHGGSSLYEFGPDGKFVRQIGKQVYGFLAAQQVRVDPHDNIWVVDRYSSMVIKLNSQGQVAMLLGRKPESVDVPSTPDNGRGNPPGSGAQSDLFQSPTDVAWDSSGNIFVADGIGNARVAKFTSDGVFVKSWGSRGNGDSQFKTAHGIAVDANGNVYVADRGNRRIQVFNGDGKFLRQFTIDVPVPPDARPAIGKIPDEAMMASGTFAPGSPWAICITPPPHQVLYSSDSWPGRIYKLSLEGKVLGMLGQSGKQLKQFGWIHALACPSENVVYAAELLNWRVQKLVLKP